MFNITIQENIFSVNKCYRRYMILLLLPMISIALNTYGQAVSAGTALVDPPTGGFHIEGDLKANTPTAHIGDWLPNAGGTGTAVLNASGVPVVASTTYHLTDLYTSGDNIFNGGLKKDHDLNTYTWKTGNPSPAKCDINNFLMHVSDDESGDTWITLGGDREATNGNSFISIALLQKKLLKNTDGTFTSDAPSSTGGRTVGDVQISAEFTGGGSNPNLYLEEWRNVGGVYKWVAFSITPMPAFGATNSAAITGMPYDIFGGTSYTINSFIEVSFNISAIYRNTSTPCVGSISTMFVMTKSSQAVNADLADFVEPLQIDLDINVGKPTASGATYCIGQTIQNLTVSGETNPTFKWYSDANLTNLLFTGSSFATGVSNASASTNDYYVTQTLKGCESQATKVTLKVNPNPTASAGTAPAAQCQNVANGNTFNLSGSGSNGTPSWAVQTNANNLTVEITNGNTFAPSVKSSGGTGSVTLRLTVTSNATSSCGTATSDVTVTVKAQVAGPRAEVLPITCTDKGFQLKISDPETGTKYTVTQPCSDYNVNKTHSSGDLIFDDLVFGAGSNVIAEKNGCQSAPNECIAVCNGLTNTSESLSQIQSSESDNTQAEPGIQNIETVRARIGSQLTKVAAVPNPFDRKVRFSLESAISGQGSLEIYNILGQKITTVYQGYIEKGRIKTIEYNVPDAQRANLIYIFRVGDQRVTGKLVGLR